jgi:hypothetical protein
MVQKIIGPNNQTGGTFVTIKYEDNGDFILTEDDEDISKRLLNDCESISCISYTSLNSMTFILKLSPIETSSIKLNSEREPHQNTRQCCIKLSLIHDTKTSDTAEAHTVAAAGDATDSGSSTPTFAGVPPSPSKPAAAVKPETLQAAAGDATDSGSSTPTFAGVPPSPSKPDAAVKPETLQAAAGAAMEQPPPSKLVFFEYNEVSIEKNVLTRDIAEQESQIQKTLFDKLFELCSESMISDRIATQVVSPDIFEQFVNRISTKSKQTDKSPINEHDVQNKLLTKHALEWFVSIAREHGFKIHIFFMDLFDVEYCIPFNQYLIPLEKNEPLDRVTGEGIVNTYLTSGYYKNVYRIVERVASQIMVVLHITGIFNTDSNSRNILVCFTPENEFENTKLIDFGLNKNLTHTETESYVKKCFRKYVKNLFDANNHPEISQICLFFTRNDFKLHVDAVYRAKWCVAHFNTLYDELIVKFSENIQKLLQSYDAKSKVTTQIRDTVFKLLMFIVFINGLIIKEQFDIDEIQCLHIMRYVFNCNIFDSLNMLYRKSSLSYTDYIHNSYESRLRILDGFTNEQYNRLCNTVLINIFNNLRTLLRVTCPRSSGQSQGGKFKSKKNKQYIKRTRRPSRKSATKRRHRRRSSNRRTSRK